MSRIELGSPQSSFFASYGKKESRASGFLREGGPGPGQFQKDGASGGVIDSAVVDVVAVDGIALAQMVPMRAKDDGFLFQVGITAGNRRRHVARFDFAYLGVEIAADPDA